MAANPKAEGDCCTRDCVLKKDWLQWKKTITAVATHIHWDHIGGHKYFSDFYAHEAELDWLTGHFPLPIQAVRNMVADRCDLTEDSHIDDYTIFQGKPSSLLNDGDCINLGDRTVQVLHTPGHSPGHMFFAICLDEHIITKLKE